VGDGATIQARSLLLGASATTTPTASLTSILLLFVIEITSPDDNPYTVLVTYILLPSILGFGLFLFFLGALLERRRRR